MRDRAILWFILKTSCHVFHSKQLRRDRKIIHGGLMCRCGSIWSVSDRICLRLTAVSAAGVTKHQYQLFIYQLSETLKETNPSHSLLPHCYRRHLYWSIILVFVLCIAMFGLLYRVYQSKILIINTSRSHTWRIVYVLIVMLWSYYASILW